MRNSAANGIAKTVEGLKDTTKIMIEETCGWFQIYCKKWFVRNHVIPLMHEMRHIIQNLENAEPYIRWLCEAECLQNIGLCQYYMKDFLPNEETLKLAIAQMEKRFGNNCLRFTIYSNLLNNLGVVLQETSRHEEAEIHLTKALDAYEK
uniref:Uncharacterized protein LOC101242715 n=1 Tax=Phallusia mammillata TaxID=59560 RepID=A0A6F9DIS0_9ASCI|nr:uncharacterized protein LOC101242715 [Phallusia mammillata]